MSYEWQDKVVLIMEGASGIGASVVRLALDEGVKHIAILDTDEKVGIAFQEKLNKQYGVGKTKFYQVDTNIDSQNQKVEQLYAVFESAVEGQGGIDVVVNNANIMNEDKKKIEMNLKALSSSTLVAIAFMRVDEGGTGGTVINISSIADEGSQSQTPIYPLYLGTKIGILKFSNCVGTEDFSARTGIRVLTVCFGVAGTAVVTPAMLGTLHTDFPPEFISDAMNTRLYVQNSDYAAKGVIEAYKLGKNGRSTWIGTRNEQVGVTIVTLAIGFK